MWVEALRMLERLIVTCGGVASIYLGNHVVFKRSMRAIALAGMGVMFCPLARADGVSLPAMQQIVDHIPLKARWQSIKVVEGTRASNSVVLWYKETPSSPSQVEVEADMEDIASQIVKALAASGHDPQKEWNGVHVHAQQGGFTTVTGKPGVKWFGTTYYDYNKDTLVWSPH
jgi:hypothetical protein